MLGLLFSKEIELFQKGSCPLPGRIFSLSWIISSPPGDTEEPLIPGNLHQVPSFLTFYDPLKALVIHGQAFGTMSKTLGMPTSGIRVPS